MPSRERGRRLCPDTPDGIPHFIEGTRASRCDQHRAERHAWSDHNSYLTKRAQQEGRQPDLLPWQPNPLLPSVRDRALRELSTQRGRDVMHTARRIEGVLQSMASARTGVPPQHWSHLAEGIRILQAQAEYLYEQAVQLGVHPDLVKQYRAGTVPGL